MTTTAASYVLLQPPCLPHSPGAWPGWPSWSRQAAPCPAITPHAAIRTKSQRGAPTPLQHPPPAEQLWSAHLLADDDVPMQHVRQVAAHELPALHQQQHQQHDDVNTSIIPQRPCASPDRLSAPYLCPRQVGAATQRQHTAHDKARAAYRARARTVSLRLDRRCV